MAAPGRRRRGLGPTRSRARSSAAGAPGQLERGRECCRRRAWADAYRSLSHADRATPLGARDLELLATSAYLIGRDGEFLRALDRAHHAHLRAGDSTPAARAAFWLGLILLLRGEAGPATGWLARAGRLLERRHCAEQGYLLLPVAEEHLAGGDHKAAYATASNAAAIGDRFGDPDLIACARHLQGRARLEQGQLGAGLGLLDEAMVAVTAGELSPIMTGLIYCSVIETCQQAYAVSRAREWTAALAHWCEQQPGMIAFTATCLVHRAEIMHLHGAWQDAIDEARRACERATLGPDPTPPASAFYQQAEVHRLRGEFTAAEEAYRRASQGGLEPQPGLALLRLAQGRLDAAVAAIRLVASATTDRLRRTRLLPAYVEIMLAVGETREARAACRELEETAERLDTDVLTAVAAHARGAVELAEADAQAALGSLRRASRAWQRMKVPYLAARVRMLMGLAHRALGDEDGSGLELDAARAAFEHLGAAPDLARIDALARSAPPGSPRGLTGRELQVLRLVATGKTNKAIATLLSLSEKTVDRHVSNVFAKLDVSSRAAATAHAYQHKLL
jgi:DNA-binding NarL/FixJ family response regulator